MSKFLLFISLLFVLSCSSEKPGDRGTQKPSGEESTTASEQSSQPFVSPESVPYSLEITPSDASRNSIVYAIPQGFSLSDAKIEWLVNGQPTTTQISSKFNAKETKKGDKVQAKATINGKEIISNVIEIKNAPPQLSRVKIMPEIFKPGDTLSVEASGSDIDGDPVTIAYEWTKNGESAGNGYRLETPIKRGDKISVRVTPYDGEVYGVSVILQREIQNMPPMITEDKNFNFDGKIYTYQVKATDPDGDPLTYNLKQAPKGMVIDKTGLITWKVSEKESGRFPVTVQVTDGHGGEALYNLDTTIGILPNPNTHPSR
jgi:hypothetical protein